MGRAFIIFVAVALAIFCLVQLVQSRHQQVRGLPRWAWALVIVLVPLLGSIGWLVLGRPRDDGTPKRPERRTIAPDDDPDFLRGLTWRQRQERGDEPNG
ncbi:MAG TPA: PLD nuclease N-terminal domain-containing protein [Nocardioidaceae bacterium]|nr:PLD nuclease N-terminal domain-containing protein [Nocardioidaceae bacterium]